MKPKFTTDFPEAVVREAADELTLRGEADSRRTFINTTNVGDKKVATAAGAVSPWNNGTRRLLQQKEEAL